MSSWTQNGRCASSHHIHVLGKKEARGKGLLPHEALSSYGGREILPSSLILPSHKSEHSHKPISDQGEWDCVLSWFVLTNQDLSSGLGRNLPSLRLSRLTLLIKSIRIVIDGNEDGISCMLSRPKKKKNRGCYTVLDSSWVKAVSVYASPFSSTWSLMG